MKYIMTYGIACIDEQQGKKELLSEIGNVTTNIEEAQHLVNTFNARMLSPEQLKNAVCEYLSEN